MCPAAVGKPIGLTEMIYQVKRELLSHEAREKDPVPIFAVDEVEIEASVQVSRGGEGGINIQVLSLGITGSQAATQTVRVTLKPILSREELIAEVQKRTPELFDKMAEQTQALLKGAQEEGGLDYA